MKYRYYFLLPILFFLISDQGYSQSGRFFTVDNDLSSSMIHDVFQDHYGYIWMATEDGLNRYDASKFTVFKNTGDQDGSVLSNFSHLVFEDQQQNLFIGFGKGLQQYNYAYNTFESIPIITENGNSVKAFVTSMLERRNGDIIIGTSGYGIFKLSEKGKSFQAEQIAKLISSDFITHLYEDKYNNLWAATQDKGLFCRTAENELINFFNKDEYPGITVTGFCEDQRGKLFLGSSKNGLFEYDTNMKTFVPVLTDDGTMLPINTLLVSRNGEILIGTEGLGLKVYNPETEHLSDGNSNVASFDFSKSKVNSILEDRSGNIWLGIYQKGVALIPATGSNFRYIGHKSINKNTIGSSSITAVYKDDQGFLWIGTDGDGIYKLYENGEFISHIKNSLGNKDVPSSVMSIFEDSEGNFWLGSYDKGLVKMNRSSGQCELMNDYFEDNKAIPIFSIQEDKNKNLWVGTLGSGLSKINLKSGITSHYYAENGSEDIKSDNLNNRWIYTLLISSDQKLYIGTVIGLGCLDLKTNSFTSTFGVNNILTDRAITALYEDNEGLLWVGSTQGLTKVNPKTNNIISFTTKNGLPGNVICAVTEDPLKNLWISTNHGISKMTKESGEFINYYAYDGLQGNEFSMRSVYTDNLGQIIFGGINGLTLFNPLEIKEEGKKPEVYFTGFYIHDRAVNKGMKSGPYEILNSPVISAETFNLAHTDNSFTVEFSAMEYSNPERIIYMYKVDRDANWIILRPGTNNVTFNNLSPGEHIFKVRAKDYNTYSDEKEISVIIHPAWFQSVPAKLIYLLIFAMICFIIVQQIRQRYRTKKRIREHLQEKKVNEAKLQFFTNIAHEIRTPMTLIINPVEKLKMADTDKERQKSYASIQRNSERILHLINQLTDIQKIDRNQMMMKFSKTDIIKFIKDLCLVFQEQAKNKQIDLAFHHQEENLKVWIDPDNFDKVILNILSNALKFTPKKGNINIEIRAGADLNDGSDLQEYCQIKVTDSGIGIKKSEKNKVFERFYQTPESRLIFKGGTGIGLHLTKSIVELHHGDIWVDENPDGAGAAFIIKIPMGNKHLRAEEIQEEDSFDQNTNLLQEFDFVGESADKVKKNSKKKYKILIVDDNQEILDYTTNELAQEYQITTCLNGKEALQFALNNQPDLIVSDVVMPEMDGVTLCRKIKQNVNVNHIPIILLTAKSSEEDKLEGLGIGADAYLTKPFHVEILKRTIQNLIRNRELLRNNYGGNQQQNSRVKQVELKPPDQVLLSKVLDVIGQNIDNSKLNVEMLSHEIGISRVHLHRKLKELTNQSAGDFIRNIRLQQAAALLRGDKPMNVSEIAYAVGFTNVAHFSNAFKKFYGTPPSSYYEYNQVKS